jgi:hypothetical protein
MIGVTLFGLFLTPVFYSVVRWFSDRRPINSAHGNERAPAGQVLDTAGAGTGGDPHTRTDEGRTHKRTSDTHITPKINEEGS